LNSHVDVQFQKINTTYGISIMLNSHVDVQFQKINTTMEFQ